MLVYTAVPLVVAKLTLRLIIYHKADFAITGVGINHSSVAIYFTFLNLSLFDFRKFGVICVWGLTFRCVEYDSGVACEIWLDGPIVYNLKLLMHLRISRLFVKLLHQLEDLSVGH